MKPRPEIVFLDVGGPLYGDRPYYQGLLAAIKEVRPDASEDEFWAEFEAARRDQRGPFTRRLAGRFVGDDQIPAVTDRGRELWHYGPEDLQPDVRQALDELAGRYRLGILANQEPWIRDVLARDGLDRYFEVWAISAEAGVEKPDRRLFEFAITEAGVAAHRCTMVGDRLDNDVVPARELGMTAVWLLRGEAPEDPTPEQRARADAAVRTLLEVPETLERLRT
ncbi:MAG TPA: HAD family hydrolase [Actinomycetota bacterium]|nr:HAD family hydrolase [Actinomycetota bacterium]